MLFGFVVRMCLDVYALFYGICQLLFCWPCMYMCVFRLLGGTIYCDLCLVVMLLDDIFAFRYRLMCLLYVCVF